MLARQRRWLVAGTLLILATVAAAVGLLAAAGWFITATALTGLALAAGIRATLDIYTPSAAIRAFAVARPLARYGERIVNHEAALRSLADIRTWLFGRLARLDPATLARFRSPDLLARLTGDTEALDNLYLRVLGPTAAALAALALATVMGTLVAPGVVLPVAVWLLAAGLLLPGLAAWAGNRLGQRLTGHLRELRLLTVDGVQGLAELRVFGGLANHLRRIADSDEAYRRARLHQSLLASLANAGSAAAIQVGLWLALVLGVAAFHDGQISGPVLALLVLGVLGLGEILGALPGAYHHLGRTRAAARRLLEAGNTRPAVIAPVRPEPLPDRLGVRLRGVWFRHLPYAEPVLQDLALEIAPEEIVLVSGPSGAGKSTLADLLLRLAEPEAGAIELGGVPLERLDPADLYRRVGYLTQRTDLFSDTIVGNLRLAAPDASDEALRQALATACLDGLVATLPNGVDTWIGPHGRRLSGGQARRLALARLILRDPALVILDEPADGLDAATARQLTINLRRWLAGRTALVVSHEPERLQFGHRHLRLERGRLAAAAGRAGSYQEDQHRTE